MRILASSAAAATLLFSTQAWAQTPPPVEYELSFDNAAHREARISVTYRDLAPGPVRFRMSRSSPGRYAVHEFAKNVYSVSAVDGAGRALPIGRTEPYSWTVSGHDGTVTVAYTLWADRGDGTYAQIDPSHARLNAPASLMWAEGHDDRGARLRFRRPDASWRIATQLAPTDDPEVFTAPNFQYLMDSPIELSPHTVREWQVDDAGVPRTIRIALHHPGSEAEADVFADRARRVVDAQIAIFGDVPDFDFGVYTFLADYVPWISGDGMEHRNSTVISTPRGLAEAEYAQIGTLSHEFFHAWNVERIRPAELEPFDFTEADPTPSLWFAEGFTSYYGPLTIRRAGVEDVDAFLDEMGGQLSFIANTPARAYGGPEEMSLRAPFVDAATSIDPTNGNIFASYYPYGAVIAMGLDLTLRARFPGVTLDDYMRLMWTRHGVPERPYTPADLERALADVTSDPAFAREVFDGWIRGSQLPDFEALLARAGVVVVPRHPGRAWAGQVSLQYANGVATLGGATAPGTPLHALGLDRGDEIVSVGDIAIDSPADWTRVLAGARPGDEVEVRFMRRGQEGAGRMTFAADPALKLQRTETAEGDLTESQRAFRRAWLGEDAAPAT